MKKSYEDLQLNFKKTFTFWESKSQEFIKDFAILFGAEQFLVS
jgi:hypothetical protein